MPSTDDAGLAPFPFDIGAEVERFFDDSSLPGDGPPRFVLLLGGVSSGKSYTRRRRYRRGFVIVDAAEIFISLSRGGYYDFPDAFLEPLFQIGALVALRAVAQRRHIVTEMLATDREGFESVVRTMTAIGYHAEVVWIDCDPAEGWRRNASRGDYDISAAHCEEFHRRWLLLAARKAGPRPPEGAGSGLGEWRLDRLAAAFPDLCPAPGAVPARPTGTSTGSGRFEDEARPDQAMAEVDISIAPSDEFVIRLPAWPAALAPRNVLEPALVRGLLKAAHHLVHPPALGCDVTVTAVRAVEGAPERALHVAGYRAFQAAARGGKWELAAPFPAVAPEPDEDPGAAFDRITGAFEAAGFALDRSPDRALSPAERLSMRAFQVHVWVEKGEAGASHIFFVCPLQWSPQVTADCAAARSRLSRDQGHDGFAAWIHVLAGYPEQAPP